MTLDRSHSDTVGHVTSTFQNIALLTHFLRQRFFTFFALPISLVFHPKPWFPKTITYRVIYEGCLESSRTLNEKSILLLKLRFIFQCSYHLGKYIALKVSWYQQHMNLRWGQSHIENQVVQLRQFVVTLLYETFRVFSHERHLWQPQVSWYWFCIWLNRSVHIWNTCGSHCDRWQNAKSVWRCLICGGLSYQPFFVASMW